MCRYKINQTNVKGNNDVAKKMYFYSDSSGAAKVPQEKIIPMTGKKIFIVHGHDKHLIYDLKEYLQTTLKFPEPTILAEVAGKGRTIIEAFEDEAEQAGLIFVLLTPDDVMESGDRQARQNVIFELGYFMGKYGRKSGRVIMLLKGPLTIPSDLDGVKRISVDNGIEEAGNEIREAIRAVL